MQRVLDGELALRGECARQLAEIRRQLTAVQHPELLSPGSFPPMATKDGAESEVRRARYVITICCLRVSSDFGVGTAAHPTAHGLGRAGR